MSNMREQFFKNLWEEHPEGTVETVGWGSEASQKQRFEKLVSIVPDKDFSGKTVLDVGCGFGDLFGYIKPKDPQEQLTYIGIDMTKKTVKVAKKKYKKHGAAFIKDNFLERNFKDAKFDYVFASGIFSIKTTDWEQNTRAIIKKMFDLCTIGVATNFLSSIHKKQLVTSQYVHPASMLTFCLREITPWVNLIHNYRTNDFTLHLYKDQEK